MEAGRPRSAAESMSPSGRFRGVGQIVRYNWPSYAAALLFLGLAAGGFVLGGDRPAVRAACAVAGIGTAFLVASSLLASYWVYERSPLTTWNWIPDALPSTPRRWLNLHAGLDESSDTLRRMLGAGVTADFFGAEEMSERSIRRARLERRPSSMKVDFARLPCSDGEFDAAFLLFSAHELRRPAARESFFQEVRRVTAPGGCILLVEHVRDLANFLAFGPGFMHFHAVAEWRRVASHAGLRIKSEKPMTPFVLTMLLERPA